MAKISVAYQQWQSSSGIAHQQRAARAYGASIVAKISGNGISAGNGEKSVISVAHGINNIEENNGGISGR